MMDVQIGNDDNNDSTDTKIKSIYQVWSRISDIKD